MNSSSEFTDSALVLKCTRYSDNDLIVNLFCSNHGAVTAFARGALKAKNSLGGRIEPYSVIDLRLKSTRGDMFTLRAVERSVRFDAIRSSWLLQKKIAVVFEVLRAGVCDAECADSVFNLTYRILLFLDSLDESKISSGSADALILSWMLKFSHLVGIDPQLSLCVRCGDEITYSVDSRVAWSSESGGAICSACFSDGDMLIIGSTLATAARLISEPLASCVSATEWSTHELNDVFRRIIVPQFEQHAAIQIKTP